MWRIKRLCAIFLLASFFTFASAQIGKFVSGRGGGRGRLQLKGEGHLLSLSHTHKHTHSLFLARSLSLFSLSLFLSCSLFLFLALSFSLFLSRVKTGHVQRLVTMMVAAIQAAQEWWPKDLLRVTATSSATALAIAALILRTLAA